MASKSKEIPPSPSSLVSILESEFHSKPNHLPAGTDLSGKVAIITGASSGLGFESSRQLLSFGLSHLVLTARSLQRGETAAAKLRKENAKATVEVWTLEMQSYDSIRSFIRRVDSQLPRLDIVILNAGVSKLSFQAVQKTGYEEMFQVNYLSTVLLSICLLPILKSRSPSGTPGRLTIVTSGLSLVAKFPNSERSPLLPSFKDEKIFSGSEAYSTSKVLPHMFLYKLIDFVSANDVIVNLVDPGLCKGTQLNREVPMILTPIVLAIKSVIARSLEHGASTYLDASIAKGKESHGCFLTNWEIRSYVAPLVLRRTFLAFDNLLASPLSCIPTLASRPLKGCGMRH